MSSQVSLENPIRRRRLELGLSQVDLAMACGVSELTVRRWETWQPRGPRDFRRIAAALEMAPAELARQYRAWHSEIASRRPR
ncbi:MAG: helix-turn-helix transcriptional regulator [Armatimonadota bacterium]|nr:helix-turn-helix transcriptional regulator [Armatimonadota bacterium]